MTSPEPNTYRRQIKNAIVSAIRARNDVAGCWEGGSAATGRVDEFSDIDLVIVASLDAADAIFDAVEDAISAVGEISHRWHVDPPPFRDTAQRFYFLAGAPRFFAVECVIVTATGFAQFLEREGHGEPQVQFDRTGQIAALPLDEHTLAYRPHRFDYGWRYVETELPEHAQHLIERYAFVADHGRLRRLSGELGEELTRRLETAIA